jgi:hypothetical protein
MVRKGAEMEGEGMDPLFEVDCEEGRVRVRD